MITNFECILRESVLGVETLLETDESPAAAGDTRWLGEAADAAARGTEKTDRKREEEARRKAEANSLAVVVVKVWFCNGRAGERVGGG